MNRSCLCTGLLVLTLVIVGAGRLVGHDEHPHPVKAVAAADLHRATPIPDRVVLTWASDPASSQAVTWRTSTDVTRGLAQLGLASEKAQTSTSEHVATTVRHETQFGPVHYHSVDFRQLAANTLYAYRVGDGVNWSEWFHFRTARAEPAPFTFVYFGDAQNDIRTHWSRVFREAFREAPRAAFTLHAGDLINRAENDAEWGEWFAAPAWVNGIIPVIATPGNHEYFNVGAGPATERLWNTKAGGTVKVTVDIKVEKDSQGQTVSHRVQARAADGTLASATLDARELFTSVDAGFTALTGFTFADLIDREPDNPPLRDRLANPGVRTLSRHWAPQFALPRNGPAGLEETVYVLDYQGARIVSLNSNERQAEQIPWLRKVLSENRQRWTILTFHHPIFSPAKGRDNAALRELWKPIFDEFKVDLVLTGHDHT